MTTRRFKTRVVNAEPSGARSQPGYLLGGDGEAIIYIRLGEWGIVYWAAPTDN
jgi:hypothetical protein